MKYLVHLTTPINTTLSAGNFRGEPRWERNVVDALLSQGRQVHTTRKVWESPLEKPSNFYDGVNEDWLDSSILVSYGVPGSISTGPTEIPKTKYRLIQYLDGPNPQTADTFLKYDREKPGSIVATCGFRAWTYLDRLRQVLGAQNVEFVEGPAVPYVVKDTNNFTQPYLFWSYRNFWDYSSREQAQLSNLFSLVAGFMSRDSTIRLGLLVYPWGPMSTEITNAMHGDRLQWFLNFGFAQQLLPYASRIDILYNLDWHAMLDMMRQTRLIISPPEPLGGSPYEAAMYGIPIILGNDANPFIDLSRTPFFPELLMTQTRTISEAFLQQLESLFSNQVIYARHGNAYRNYVENHGTYQAWVSQIDSICQKRGWLC